MRFFGIFVSLWLAATSLFAQDADAIEGVIGGQLEAFNQRDVGEAWQYASPNIQRMFGNSTNFGVMVQRGYPMVWDNADVRFLELREINGFLWQKVIVRDRAGEFHALDYQMIETANGWQINGVTLVPLPDVGA